MNRMGVREQESMNWVKLTRPMRDAKLTWVLGAFREAGVPHRINGDMLEPWVEVAAKDEQCGRLITLAVDALSDDDPMFVSARSVHGPAWWFHERRRLGECLGGIGVLASKFRRNLADTVECVPDGASPYDCPYATGVIPACPVQLWEACRPMVRLECFTLGVAEALDGRETQSLWWAESLVAAVRGQLGETPEAIALLTMFNVMAKWLSNGTMCRLVGLSDQGPGAIVAAVFADTFTKVGSIVFPQILDLGVRKAHPYPRGGAELN